MFCHGLLKIITQSQMLSHLPLNCSSLEINGKQVFYEENNNQTVIPYKLWDQEIPVLETASVCLYGNEEPADIKEWSNWLSDEDSDNFDLDLEFNYKPSEFGAALRAEFNSFDQFTMLMVTDRSKKYWILATFDDTENAGFTMDAFIPRGTMNMEEAFPYLMALFHLNYFNIMAGIEGDDADFEEVINSCDILEGISREAQEKAREFAKVFYENIKDDEEFWKVF